MPGKRGMHLGVGEVVEVGVVLASERFAEGGGNHDSRGEVWIAEDVKTITRGEEIRVDRRMQGSRGQPVERTASLGGTRVGRSCAWRRDIRAVGGAV